MTDDHERMQRYLEWRERTDRTARRRARRRAAGVGVAVAAVALIAPSDVDRCSAAP